MSKEIKQKKKLSRYGTRFLWIVKCIKYIFSERENENRKKNEKRKKTPSDLIYSFWISLAFSITISVILDAPLIKNNGRISSKTQERKINKWCILKIGNAYINLSVLFLYTNIVDRFPSTDLRYETITIQFFSFSFDVSKIRRFLEMCIGLYADWQWYGWKRLPPQCDWPLSLF